MKLREYKQEKIIIIKIKIIMALST